MYIYLDNDKLLLYINIHLILRINEFKKIRYNVLFLGGTGV
jgi:hypothetical protein